MDQIRAACLFRSREIPMTDTGLGNALDLLEDLIARAKRAGADNEKIAPAVQSGKASSRVRGGKIAPISMVLPAPTASEQKNSIRNAPDLSCGALGGGRVSESGITSPA